MMLHFPALVLHLKLCLYEVEHTAVSVHLDLPAGLVTPV